MSACCLPHVVIFFEQSIVFNCPLLELHVYTAAIDADDASDAAARWKDKEKERAVRGTFVQLWHGTRLQTNKQTKKAQSSVGILGRKISSLHVVSDARAQFHGGSESETSGCRRWHVRLQDRLQGVEDIVLTDLTKENQLLLSYMIKAYSIHHTYDKEILICEYLRICTSISSLHHSIKSYTLHIFMWLFFTKLHWSRLIF